MLKLFNPFNLHTLFVACLVLPTSLIFVGCEADDGPMEKAGENLDEAAEEAEDELDDATSS